MKIKAGNILSIFIFIESGENKERKKIIENSEEMHLTYKHARWRVLHHKSKEIYSKT